MFYYRDVIESEYIVWEAADGDHPARLAGQRSYDAVGRGAKEEWLDLFAPDAVVEDPVGPSMFDPEGKGHHGREAIAAFWDQAIAPVSRFRFTIHDSFAGGDSCANVATFRTTFPDGSGVDVDLVTVHRVDEAGRIVSMRAHWEPERVRPVA